MTTPAEIGKTIKEGRAKGLDIRHRPKGWTVTTPAGQATNFFPAQAAEFVRFVERWQQPRYADLPATTKLLAQGVWDILVALGFEEPGNPEADIADHGGDLEAWINEVVSDVDVEFAGEAQSA